MKRSTQSKAFSLVELVIVVVIIGVLAAIAIPRLSRGAAGAADSSVHGNLKVLRTAIDLYASEHGGTFPTAANISDQLTKYTDDTGATSATKTGNFVYGPYIRSVPALPVGAKKNSTGIAAADGTGVGWIYVEASGSIATNTTAAEVDAKGTKYSDY